jgi:peptidoglycan/LPS O-acetylase OafA/YrhL
MKSLNLPYSPKIDQLRWMAALLVFLFHFLMEYRGLGGAGPASSWFGILTEGHTGVGLFFTLSGFLFMQIALHQRQIVYRDFMRNRFLRIFPLFFTVYLVATSIGFDKFQPQDIFYLLATNLGNAPTSGSIVTGPAWCISLEFLFYLLFPFLSRFAMERGARYLVSLVLLMLFFKLAAYTVTARSTHMFYSTFVGRFDQFLIGMLAGQLYQHRQAALRKWAGWLLPLAAAFVIGNSALQAQVAPFGAAPKSAFWVMWSTLESTGWACVILAWTAWQGALPAWLDRLLCHGGKISFSFYLLHLAVLHLLAQTFGMVTVTGNVYADALFMLLAAYTATWGLATLSYRTIEEPFLGLRRAYGGAGDAAPAQGAALAAVREIRRPPAASPID